jgi:hypothetical protein
MNNLVKPFTLILGIVLLAVGIVGFVMDPVLIFDVNVAHNLVHLASGLVAVICYAMGYQASRMYLIVFGLVYALVTVLGFLAVQPVVDLLQLNEADNYLHLAIAAACLVLGFGSSKNA